MSAWYVFSALGFYPVNSAGGEYAVGTPFFERVVLRLPRGAATGGEVGSSEGRDRELVISAPGAPKKPYVKGLTIDGESKETPVITHRELVNAALIVFEMSETPSAWGSQVV